MVVCPQWVKSVDGLVHEVTKITIPHKVTAVAERHEYETVRKSAMKT